MCESIHKPLPIDILRDDLYIFTCPKVHGYLLPLFMAACELLFAQTNSAICPPSEGRASRSKARLPSRLGLAGGGRGPLFGLAFASLRLRACAQGGWSQCLGGHSRASVLKLSRETWLPRLPLYRGHFDVDVLELGGVKALQNSQRGQGFPHLYAVACFVRKLAGFHVP